MRTRLKQRTTIRKFVEYLEQRHIDLNPEFRSGGGEAYISEIEQHFGVELAKEIEIERQKETEAKLIATKLNGRLVMEWIPECRGKVLGQLLKNVHAQVTKDQLLTMSPSD
ncbi:MAG: hypothetical protein SGARI_002152, partial [Bacillariaceae sp.]